MVKKVRIRVVGGMVVAFTCLLSLAAARATDCMSLTLDTAISSSQIGDKIVVHITLRNCGINTIKWQHYGIGDTGYSDYLVSMTRADNSELEKSQEYRRLLSPLSIDHVFVSQLSAGQGESSTTDLRNMFHVDTPGTYHIIAATKVPDSIEGLKEVRSNTLTLVIEPKTQTLP